MIVSINEKDLKKLVNNAVIGILDTLNITKKEGSLESLPLCHFFQKLFFNSSFDF